VTLKFDYGSKLRLGAEIQGQKVKFARFGEVFAWVTQWVKTRKEKVMEENIKDQKNKHKFALYVSDEILDIARELYERDNCRSVSEFICKAIQFYGGFVTNSKLNQDYVPQIVLSTLKAIMRDSENRHSGSLFRIAVEISMIKNLLAFSHGIGEAPLNKLRNDCISEVKKINGTISYEEAIRWQT